MTKLYPHGPATLLPLVRKHFPGSLRVYGTLTSNPSLPYPVYTNFPSTSISTDTIPDIWVVIVTLPVPLNDQTRFYCSLDQNDDIVSERGEETRVAGMKLVRESLEAYRNIVPTKKIGAIDCLWTKELREVWNLRPGVTYWYWLAQDGISNGTTATSERNIANREGLIIDVGREIDVDIVSVYPRSSIHFIVFILPGIISS